MAKSKTGFTVHLNVSYRGRQYAQVRYVKAYDETGARLASQELVESEGYIFKKVVSTKADA